MKELKAPANVRLRQPRTCAWCRYYRQTPDGVWWCHRGVLDRWVSADVGDGDQYVVTCDGFKKGDGP